MAEFTKEQLIEEVNYNLEHCFCSDKTKRLMEIALAALTETQLPQPAVLSVPDEIPKLKDGMGFKYVKDGVRYSLNYANGWNQCRAAMLQSGNFRENKNSSTNNFREIAETSTNYPVIPSEVLSAIQKVAKIRADFDDFDGDRRGIGDCLDEAEQELIVTINKYASQLAAEPIAPNDVREQTAIPQVPVTPDGWVMVPKEPTQAMIKAWLSEIANFRGHAAGYRAALEAAPQLEVNRG
ncbi:hypothetical protein GVH92_09415 [Escherichia coli]|nr:hypothetical protein [Escherichia coli]